MAYPFLIIRPYHIVPPVNCVNLWINLNSVCVVWSKSTRSWVQEDMEKVYRSHSRCRPISCCPKRYFGTAWLDMTFASVGWRKTIGIVMNSPRNKQIFAGNFSYKLILEVILQNYRRTIWNGGQYGMAYPFLIVRPCHIVPPLNCVSLWINLTSACVLWSNSSRSSVQEDM